jgi:hypothetical protein
MTDAYLRHEYFAMDEEKAAYRMIIRPAAKGSR